MRLIVTNLIIDPDSRCPAALPHRCPRRSRALRCATGTARLIDDPTNCGSAISACPSSGAGCATTGGNLEIVVERWSEPLAEMTANGRWRLVSQSTKSVERGISAVSERSITLRVEFAEPRSTEPWPLATGLRHRLRHIGLSVSEDFQRAAVCRTCGQIKIEHIQGRERRSAARIRRIRSPTVRRLKPMSRMIPFVRPMSRMIPFRSTVE
jgi:hypothetical protein